MPGLGGVAARKRTKADDDEEDGDRQEAAFSVANRHEDEEYDPSDETKLGRQVGRSAAGTLFAFGGLFGANEAWVGDSSDDEDHRIGPDLPVWGGEAIDERAGGAGPSADPAGGSEAGGEAVGDGGAAAGLPGTPHRSSWGDAGAGSDDGSEAGGVSAERRGYATLADLGGGGLRGARRRDGEERFGRAALGGGRGGAATAGEPWSWDMAGLTADFREGAGLPEGLQLLGAEPELIEDEDGTKALAMPPDEKCAQTENITRHACGAD